ncbi:MAG TPA: molybdopterin-guanine dinucleotide biosynthesis protein MobB [Gaiellaceae bacterium]|nr:molybdopterin-guanine dinucleotide biosynthesis protein MobB [Gaiellaceae bacterium]
MTETTAPAYDERRLWAPVGANVVFTSVTRVADLSERLDLVEQLPRGQWDGGDFVAATVLERPGFSHTVETTTGRMAEVFPGDVLIGALGTRFATLESVGDWRDVGEDLLLESLTRAGVFGKCTSVAPQSMAQVISLRYLGHLLHDGEKLRMADFVERLPPRELGAPVVLVIGTSMSAGKTTTAKILIRLLKRRGLRVGAAKLTGVARFADSLAMRDAGADHVVDFVDAGLASTMCEAATYRDALDHIVSSLAGADVDMVVAEAGASPLEPYNVDLAEQELEDQVRFTILCASDPYAVVGVAEAYGIVPDVVAGKATSTEAGVVLSERLSGVRALNVLSRDGQIELDRLVSSQLGL